MRTITVSKDDYYTLKDLKVGEQVQITTVDRKAMVFTKSEVVKEMTLAEIEKKLGYKIKLVEGNDD